MIVKKGRERPFPKTNKIKLKDRTLVSINNKYNNENFFFSILMQMYGKDFGIPNIKLFVQSKKNLQGFGIVDFLPYICNIERHPQTHSFTTSSTHNRVFFETRDIYQTKGEFNDGRRETKDWNISRNRYGHQSRKA